MHLGNSNYIKIAKMSEGSYGAVYRVRNSNTGKDYAMKVTKFASDEFGIPPETLREVSALVSLKHPNIISLKDVITSPGEIIIVEEFVSKNLHSYLFSTNGIPNDDWICSNAFQLLCGICYCHTHRIMHRDLKPENILIDKSGFLKICDFGMARNFTLPMRQYSPRVVTFSYKAPELLFGKGYYDMSIDIWSAGCIIAEMCTKKVVFYAKDDSEQLHAIFRILGSPTPENFPGYDILVEQYGDTLLHYEKKDLSTVLNTRNEYLIDLISKMLVFNPTKRITALQALRHPFFNGVNPYLRDACFPTHHQNKY